MFCPNCGTQLAGNVNFCPNCGTQVTNIAQTIAAKNVNQGNMVMMLSLGTCSRTTAAALLQQICGYASDDALLIADSAPITIARGLNDAQARYLAQALTEYGLEVAVYDGTGWREWESNSASVWDNAGALVSGVAAALGLISLNNRISRDMMHRWDYPYRFSGARPPVYRLHNTLRAVPTRRVAPVRPPVHHAPPPPPPRPAPAPARPAPQPPRPAPASARPAPPPPRPAQPPRPAPQPPRPAPSHPTPANPAPGPGRPSGPMPHPGNGGKPGGRPGGGVGRGGPGRP